MSSTTNNRKIYLDVLRIVAIILVIFHHTEDKGFLLYAFDCPTYLKAIYVATAAIVEPAVPLFFIISGALLLNREESIQDIYRKRVLRIVIVLALFSVLQYGYAVIFCGEPFSLKFFIKTVVTDHMAVAYWYLYAYLAFLICLPFIRKLAKNMTNTEFKYLFIVFLSIEGVIGACTTLLGWELNGFFVIPFCNRVIIYPLLGYYMEHRLDRSEYNIRGMIRWIICIIAVVSYIVIMTFVRDVPPEEYNIYDKGLFLSGFSILIDAGLYYIARFVFGSPRLPKGLAIVLSYLGTCVFGVFLIENIIRDKTQFIYFTFVPYVGKYISAWFWVIIVFVIGVAIISIVKLIPGVRKLL